MLWWKRSGEAFSTKGRKEREQKKEGKIGRTWSFSRIGKVENNIGNKTCARQESPPQPARHACNRQKIVRRKMSSLVKNCPAHRLCLAHLQPTTNGWTCDFLKECLVNKIFFLERTEWYICWCHYQNFEKNEYDKMIENMVCKGHTSGHHFRDSTRKAQSGNNQWAQRPDFKLWISDCYHESVTLPSALLLISSGTTVRFLSTLCSEKTQQPLRVLPIRCGNFLVALLLNTSPEKCMAHTCHIHLSELNR